MTGLIIYYLRTKNEMCFGIADSMNTHLTQIHFRFKQFTATQYGIMT